MTEEGSYALAKSIEEYYAKKSIQSYVNLEIIEADPDVCNTIHSYLKTKGLKRIEENEQEKIDKNYYVMISNMIRINKDIIKLSLGILQIDNKKLRYEGIKIISDPLKINQTIQSLSLSFIY